MTIENNAAISDEGVTPAWYATVDFKRRALITLAALAIYRIAENIPVPVIGAQVWKAALEKESLFTLIFAPEDVARFSIMALGVFPLLFVCVVFELLRLCAPSFGRWIEAAPGRQVRAQGVLYGCALLIAAWQALQLADELEAPDSLWRFGIIATLLGGVAITIGLSKWIYKAGLGHGIWAIAALVYVGELLRTALSTIGPVQQGKLSTLGTGLLAAYLVVCVVAIVKIEKARGYNSDATSVMNPGGFWPLLLAGMVAAWLMVLVHISVLDIVLSIQIQPFLRIGTSLALVGLILWRYASIARTNSTAAGPAGIIPDWVKCWIVFSAMFLAEFLLEHVGGVPPAISPGALAVIVITILRMTRHEPEKLTRLG